MQELTSFYRIKNRAGFYYDNNGDWSERGFVFTSLDELQAALTKFELYQLKQLQIEANDIARAVDIDRADRFKK